MRYIRTLCLLAAVLPLAVPAAVAAAPGHEEKMREGDQAARQQEWEKAIKAYKEAEDVARNGEQRADAALQRALTIRKWFPDDPSLASHKKRRDEVIACYRVVIRNGPKPKAELACNNLGVLYVRMEEYDEAVQTFRQAGTPVNPDAHLFHFNFGRALASAGSPDAAYEQYWMALKKRPTFAAAANQACEALRARKVSGRYSEAAGLFAFLLAPSSRQLTVVGEQIPRFLAEWGADKALLRSLLGYYEAARVDPQKFKEKELPRLDTIRTPGLPAKVKGLQRAYLTEGFEERRLKRSAVLFDSREEVLAFFPAWGPLLAEEKELARAFARLLKRAGDYYHRQSLSGEEGDSAKGEAARQALARYSASFLLDRGNIEAAFCAASTLAQHPGRIDPDGKLLKALVGQLYGKGRALEAEAKTKHDWVNVYSCHVVLGDLFERKKKWGAEEKKWGAEDNPDGAVYHWLKALQAERRIRREFDPNHPELHSLGARLGRAYWNAGDRKQAFESYLAAADQFALYGNSRRVLGTLEEVRKQASAAKVPFSGVEKARLEGLTVVAKNLGEVKTRAVVPGQGNLLALSFSADSRSLLTGVGGPWARLLVWDAGTGKGPRFDPWWDSNVSVMAFAPDCKTYACGKGASVLVCHVGSGTSRVLSPDHKGPVLALAFSGDSERLASADARGTVKVWDLVTGKEQRAFAGLNEVQCLAFAPDGKLLAGGHGVGVKLWNTATGKEIMVLKGHTGRVTALSFSPDGKRLASGGADRCVKLWALDGGKELASFEGHRRSTRSVQFSPDGKALLSADEEGSVKLRDPDTGQEKARLPLPRGGFTSAAFARDGKTLAVGSGPSTQWGTQTSGQIKLWDIGRVVSPGPAP